MADEKNHWDSLASDLGAEATEPEEASEPSENLATDETAPEFDAVAASRPMSPQPTASWDDLVSSLGLSEADEAAAQAPEVASQPVSGGEEEQAVTLPFAETATRSGSEEQGTDETAEPAQNEPTDRARKGRRRRRRRGKSASSPKGNDEGTVDEVFSGNIDKLEETIDFSSTDSPDESESGSESAESVAAQESEDPDKDGVRRKRRRRRGRRGGRRNSGEATTTDESAGDVEDDGPDDSESTSRRPSHRNIPTWEETVGVIVTANQDARSKSPKSGRSSSGRESGGRRGRGRGRGSRGKSEPRKDDSSD